MSDNNDNPAKANVMIYDLHETFSSVMMEIFKIYGNIHSQWFNNIDIAQQALEEIPYDWVLIATDHDCQQLIDYVRDSKLNHNTPVKVVLPGQLLAKKPNIIEDEFTELKLLEHPAELVMMIDTFAQPWMIAKE